MYTFESSATFFSQPRPNGRPTSVLIVLRGSSRRSNREFGLQLGQAALNFANHAHEPPMLRLGQWAALHDLDGVAGAGLVLLIVNVADRPPANVLAIARVLHEPRDLNPARLVHLVAGDDAYRDATDSPG